MASNDKKVFVAVIGGVTKALRKAYDVLNRNEHLPEVEDTALPGLANHIIRALHKDLTEIEENERFDGLEYEQIVELKDAERKEQLAALQDQAGQLLKSLREPEPAFDDEELFEEPNPELNKDPDTEHNEEPGNEPDEDSENEPLIINQVLADLSLKDLIDLYNKGTDEIKAIDLDSEEFEIRRLGLVSFKEEIEKRQLQPGA